MSPIPFRMKKIYAEPIEMHPDLVNTNIEDFTVNSSFSFGGELIPGIVTCRGEFSFVQGEVELSKLTVYCYFEIDPEYVQANMSDNKLVIDKEFLRYIATVTVGTARGIQYAKTQNTILNGMVLPPINLMELNLQDMDLQDPED
ncbi:MAG: hypothetical protein MJZ97_08740 [Bacteroidales bacterium]|nr:hypothetical protein [Bacteroidales bacterium]